MIERRPGLLVFSKTAGYRHESIPAGVAAVREIGADAGLDVEATEDAAVLASERLRHASRRVVRVGDRPAPGQ